MRFDRKGFTLIELIIVIVIIGILASIAAPMMAGLAKKAIYTEAITALSSVRTSLRTYYAEYGDYPRSLTGLPGFSMTIGPGGSSTTYSIRLSSAAGSYFPGLTLTDGSAYGGSSLDGIYFSQNCYRYGYTSASGSVSGYFVKCDISNPTNNLAPKSSDASKTGLSLIQMSLGDGQITIL